MIAVRAGTFLLLIALGLGCQSQPPTHARRVERSWENRQVDPNPKPLAHTTGRYSDFPSDLSSRGNLELQEEPSEQPLGIREAIEISLAHSDVVKTLNGGRVRTDPATAYDPVILSQQILVEQAGFDPAVAVNFSGGRFDEPSETPGLGDRSKSLNRHESNISAELSKKWTPGTVTSVAYAPPLAYLYLPVPSRSLVNPLIGSAVVLEARQPLLRGAGERVNIAPIQIAQLKRDQSTWELKAALLEQVRNIEEAYWELQAAHTTLQALDQIIPLLDDAVRIEELRLQAELVTIAEVARVRLQRNEFQQERIRTKANIQRREYALRTLLGLPVESPQRFLPVEPPQTGWQDFSLEQAVSVALEHRPDIVRQRLQLRVREIEWGIAKNRTHPQWDLTALYRASGISDQFEETFDQISKLQYADWTVGMEFSVPLGNRAARSNQAAAEERFHREQAVFQQHLKNVSFELADLIRDLKATAQEYELARQRVSDSQAWVQTARIRFSSPPSAGRSQDWLLVALDDFQFALRRHIDAITDASRLLGEYNSLLARLHEAQGTLLDQRLVELQEDPLTIVKENAPVWFGHGRYAAPKHATPNTPRPGWSAPAVP